MLITELSTHITKLSEKMKQTLIFLGLVAGMIFSAGCKSGPCLRKDLNKESLAASDAKTTPAEAPPAPRHARIKVAKSDGSLQCGKGKQISLTEMSKQLAGIQIYSEENLNDGMMRIQVCGAPTGQFNVYEISQEDLKKATGLGFKQWMK